MLTSSRVRVGVMFVGVVQNWTPPSSRACGGLWRRKIVPPEFPITHTQASKIQFWILSSTWSATKNPAHGRAVVVIRLKAQAMVAKAAMQACGF